MAKYCANCGKKLEDGEKCDCQKSQTNNEVVSGYASTIIGLLKGMFTSPCKTVKEFKDENNFKVGIIFALIVSVIVALFSLILVKELYALTVSTYTFGGYSFVQNVEVPYFETFIIVLISSFVIYFIQAGVLYLVNAQIFKAKMNYKNAFNTMSALSVFTLAGIVLGSIGALIAMPVCLVIIIILCLFNIICLTLINKEVYKLNDRNTLYSIILYFAIMAVVSYLIMLIFN